MIKNQKPQLTVSDACALMTRAVLLSVLVFVVAFVLFRADGPDVALTILQAILTALKKA